MTPETLKVEVAEWLLKHGEETIKDLQSRISPNYKLLPDFAYHIFLDSYEDEALSLLKKSVVTSLNINSEDLNLFFSKRFVIMLLGNEILSPPKI